MSCDDQELNENYRKFAQPLIEAVGLSLVAGVDATSLGREAGSYAFMVVRIRALGEQPPNRKKIAAAKSIQRKANQLRDAITEFEKSWPYVPWHVDMQLYQMFMKEKDGFAEFYAAEHAMQIECLSRVQNRFEKIAGLAEYDAEMSRGFAAFIGGPLARCYTTYFGEKPGYTFNPVVNEYDGPFIRFARFILEYGGANISDAAIASAVTKARKERPK